MFHNMGAKVTCSDARIEHLDLIMKKHPHLETVRIDCDDFNVSKSYDIILHWGVLYHLKEIDVHLKKVLQYCDYFCF